MCEFGPGPATALPGGIGISLLKVYDLQAPDGSAGGSPHVHLACSEGYYVVAGSGSVQTLNPKGFTQTPLEAGAVVWFDPGTIHRLVNGGSLQILALMSNSGLPEAGDAVLTLPPEHLTDRETYLKATTLTGEGEARTTSAMARRNLALDGFAVLRESYETDGPSALDDFYAAAVRIVQPQLPDWRRRWDQGARRLAEQTGAALDALEAGTAPHLQTAELHELPAPTEFGLHGMCGRLDIYDISSREAEQ
ncbi:cupin domain-containing protein [Kribbella sp. NBC_00889]|uniref:cupin domain-containing protein n=1 Tax=Kribbella sp. NBC_00889 TaxID=2975974 RepID=UPI00386D2680|nr:cupin domain-containing protein [Kribbella sp. NBC_00889]